MGVGGGGSLLWPVWLQEIRKGQHGTSVGGQTGRLVTVAVREQETNAFRVHETSKKKNLFAIAAGK